MPAPATAVLLTVGNEIVSGDVENTNASWLARRLAALGVSVRLIACVRDEIEEVAAFLRAEGPHADVVIVTGGLGGTPDDLTREAVAAAFGVPTEEQEPLASRSCASASPPAASASTRPAGPASRAARRRSTTRSAARRGSWSGTSTCCPASRARCRRCSTRLPTGSRAARRSRRGGAATGRPRARSWPCSRRRPAASPPSPSAATRASPPTGPRWTSSSSRPTRPRSRRRSRGSKGALP